MSQQEAQAGIGRGGRKLMRGGAGEIKAAKGERRGGGGGDEHAMKKITKLKREAGSRQHWK